MKVSFWRSTYVFNEFDGEIKKSCPSFRQKVDLLIGGKLDSIIKSSVISLVSRSELQDCHGNVLYVMKTGNSFQTIVNNIKISVSFELRDKEDKETLAYISGNHFWGDKIDVMDPDGKVVARLEREMAIFSKREWKVETIEPNAPGANPRVLSMIAGQRTFSENDFCNSMFGAAIWISGVIAALFLIVLCHLIIPKLNELRHRRLY